MLSVKQARKAARMPARVRIGDYRWAGWFKWYRARKNPRAKP